MRQYRNAIGVLHAFAIINLIVGVVYLILTSYGLGDGPLSIVDIVILLFIVGIVVFIEIVIHYLKQHKFWAWVAAIIICGINIPSILFFLGIIGLMSLTNKDTKAIFFKQHP